MMRCEEAEPMLPEMAEGRIREAGLLEGHVASCSRCSAELRRFRAIVLELGSLKDALIEPPDGSLEHVLDRMLVPMRPRLVHRLAEDDRLRRVALSVAGAAVGATAVGLVWWRTARRLRSA